jgi:hypothetical protein
MTGYPPGGGGAAGLHTLRYKQSSLSSGIGVLKIEMVKFRIFSGSKMITSKPFLPHSALSAYKKTAAHKLA